MTMQSRAGMRALENSSSSEEEDRADLLGRSFQVPRPKSRSNGSIAVSTPIYIYTDTLLRSDHNSNKNIFRIRQTESIGHLLRRGLRAIRW